MIKLNDIELEFDRIGLFTTNAAWIHPEFTERTYELICVQEGEVWLWEDGREFHLLSGDLILLRPDIPHRGSRVSEGATAFYWAHFYASRPPNREIPPLLVRGFSSPYLFRELLHCASMPGGPRYRMDALLAHILSLLPNETEEASIPAIVSSVVEWTRINVRNGLTAEAVAQHFGYNRDHLSRLTKQHYGLSLKTLIDSFLIKRAKNFLGNSTYSVKEIARLLGFPSDNAFINFYQYHEKTSPSQYRNRYPHTHMNNA